MHVFIHIHTQCMHIHTYLQASRKPVSAEIGFSWLLWIKTISNRITRFPPDTRSVPYTEYVLDKSKYNLKFDIFFPHKQK